MNISTSDSDAAGAVAGEPDSAPPDLAMTTLSRLLEKIDSCTARVGVIGLGYVGLPLALLLLH